jgi:hypothetical protein
MIDAIPNVFLKLRQTEVEIIRIIESLAGFLATFVSIYDCIEKQSPIAIPSLARRPWRYKITFFANRQGLPNN